ncbi:hypothetical protein EBR03_09555, partial [bacterium]|nr:hypothetical protein [bacterium]
AGQSLRRLISTEIELAGLFKSNSIRLSVGYMEIPGITREIIGYETMVPVISTDYDMQISELPIPLISVLGLEKLMQEFRELLLLRCGIETRTEIQVDNVIAAKFAASGGAGIAVIPDHLVSSELIPLVEESFFIKIPVFAHRKHRVKRNCFRRIEA